MSELTDRLKDLQEKKERVVAEESIWLRKALESEDPDALIKANQFLSGVYQRNKGDAKAYFFDPSAYQRSNGYLTEPNRITDGMLRRMANAPIIKAIIETRVEQIASFLQPQSDKYSTGFVIRKKKGYFQDNKQDKQTNEDKRIIERLTDFIIKCGMEGNTWHGDDFDSWGRKVVKDSLSMDKLASEVIRDRKGIPIEYIAIDASTVRLADNREEQPGYTQKKKIQGYYPSHVQIYNDQIVAEFYPWEMMWGIRNPTSNIYFNGYGESELEVLIQTVTAMLQSDVYNQNVFKLGSVPEGLFRISGNVNEARLKEFRQQWISQLQGYANSHKMGFVEADKMDFVDLRKSNRDMEFSKYQEYLIKLACAIYKISPEEIGFSIQESADRNSMFEADNETKLKFSKDKGLKPLLKFLQSKIQKYLIEPVNPEYEFVFVGLDAETEEKELEQQIKKVTSFKGLKEVRGDRGLPDEIDEDDVILNPVWMQYKMSQMQGNPESNQFIDEEERDKEVNKSVDVNPMMQDFNSFVEKELMADA